MTTTTMSDPRQSPQSPARIEASGNVQATPNRLAINATMPVEIVQAAKAGAGGDDSAPRRPTFDILGYTGAVVNVGGFFSPVIVDLAGLKAASQTIPALRSHDDDRIVGQTDSIAIDKDGVRLTGTITGDNEDASEVVSQSKNGFKWQASIGASIERREFLEAGKSATVNGRSVSGPLIIARESTLYEISFVAIGADGQTSAGVAASNPSASSHVESTMNFEAWLQAKGFDPAAISEAQKTSLQALYNAEQSMLRAQAERGGGGGGSGNSNNGNGNGRTDNVQAEGKKSLDDSIGEIKARQARHGTIQAMTLEFCQERPSLIDDLKGLAEVAIEADESVEKFELAARRLMGTISNPAIIVKSGGRRQSDTKVIEAAVCKAGGLEGIEKRFDAKALEAADEHFRHGIGLGELLQIAARENGHAGHISARDVRELLQAAFLPASGIRASGFSTFSLPGIMGNVANKFLMAGFDAVENAWRSIASRTPVQDFKQITSYSLTGGFIYEEVGPSGELKHATAGEMEYTNQAKTYGRMFAVTRRDIINDDLGALTQVPRRLGRGAALKLNDVFWRTFMDNAAFFTTARGNYFEGGTSNLGINSLTTAETMFMDQTDEDGYPVAIMPRILLVPNGLNVTASSLMNSTEIRDNTANTLITTNNPHAGKYNVVRSSYLSNTSYTGNSTTKWYLLAGPDDLPVIDVAFLNGRETPIVESADADFDTLGVQFRGYHDWGVSLQEFRAGVASKGTA